MPLKCPKGTKVGYRYRKIKGGKQRLGGCMRKGRFVKVKEVKTIKNKRNPLSKVKSVRINIDNKYIGRASQKNGRINVTVKKKREKLFGIF